jgi:hypothetical protein
MHTATLIPARSIPLVVALALGSFALGALATAKLAAVPAAPRAAQGQVPSFAGGDPSVPAASTVSFPVDAPEAAPTF